MSQSLLKAAIKSAIVNNEFNVNKLVELLASIPEEKLAEIIAL